MTHTLNQLKELCKRTAKLSRSIRRTDVTKQEFEAWEDLCNAHFEALPRLVEWVGRARGWLVPAMLAIGMSGADKDLEAVTEIKKLLAEIEGEE